MRLIFGRFLCLSSILIQHLQTFGKWYLGFDAFWIARGSFVGSEIERESVRGGESEGMREDELEGSLAIATSCLLGGGKSERSVWESFSFLSFEKGNEAELETESESESARGEEGEIDDDFEFESADVVAV